MKKTRQPKKFYNDPNFRYAILVILLILIVGYLIPGEPHFKILKQVCGPPTDVGNNWTNTKCSLLAVKGDVIDFCYSKSDCGKVQIDEKLLKEGWLNQYCEVLYSNCTYVKKPQKIDTSKEYISNTIQTPNCLNLDNCFDLVCKGPIEYKCQDYIIEVSK